MNEKESREDIFFQIDMQLYSEFNDKIANAYDHLGEGTTYQDIKDLEEAEKDREIGLLREAVKKLQKENEELQFFAESYRKQIELMQNEYKTGNFIHKGFIKDKIEELEEHKKHEEGVALRYSEVGATQGKINILKKLLEEE